MRLRDKFLRLYSLEENKICVIADRLECSVDGAVGKWVWRRGLFTWEEDLVCELLSLLNRCNLQSHGADRWTWCTARQTTYSTKQGYEVLMGRRIDEADRDLEWPRLVWNKWSPKNINAFVWKLIYERVPVRTNLKKRNIIHAAVTSLCPLCDANEEESVEHLFLKCDFAGLVWKKSGGMAGC